MSVVNLAERKCNVAKELRDLADSIDRGECAATSAIVVMQNRVDQVISRTFLGEQISYSQWLGLLAYASHMVYAECRRESGDG